MEYTRAAGDVRAIGDWFRSTRYLKEEVDEFFLLKNQYTPYTVIVYADVNSEITITGQTSGRSYNIKMLETKVSELMFFSNGETVIANDGTETKTVVLSSPIVEIDYFGISEQYYIDVVTPPTKLEYFSGETIDITGLVIHKYRMTDGTDLGAITDFEYTEKASPRTDFKCGRDNAYAYNVNDVLFRNNGNAVYSPIYKVNNGKSVHFLGINSGGDDYGGGWFSPWGISDTADKAEMTTNSQFNVGPITKNNITFYYTMVGWNARYQGITEFYDNTYPEFKNVRLFMPNEWTDQAFNKIIQFLQLEVVGGAITITTRDENNKKLMCQYGIEVHEGSNVIPTMTSNTDPSGEVIYDSVQGCIGCGVNVVAAGVDKTYYVFTDDNDKGICNNGENTFGYIEYDFDNDVSINEVILEGGIASMGSYYRDFTLRVDLYINNAWVEMGKILMTNNVGMPAPMNHYSLKPGTVYSNVEKLRITSETQKTYGNGWTIRQIKAYGST